MKAWELGRLLLEGPDLEVMFPMDENTLARVVDAEQGEDEFIALGWVPE